MDQYVIGLDYGTDSVRALLINAKTGYELASDVHIYHRWKKGQYCNPLLNQFRQHPLDHIEGLEATIKGILSKSAIDRSAVKGICVDTTGSSPIPVDKEGKALCFQRQHAENPNAMMVLWKDHTAIKEADEINNLARTWGGPDFTKYEGGVYSSEWFWAKILHIIRIDPILREDAFSWVEHCDYITHTLIGSTEIKELKRSRCAAGHKAMWHTDWNGLPPKVFLEQLDPELASLRDRLYEETYTSDEIAGHLSSEWAENLGLSTDVIISVGTFDAHAGAVGAKIDNGSLVRVMGTSTCDMMVTSQSSLGMKTIKGICGQVDGSIIPGMIGLEAGQSAFGDVLAWFKSVLMWPIDELVLKSDHLSLETANRLNQEIHKSFMAKLTEQAANIAADEALPMALDWINGRRTPDADQSLKSAISNLSLSSGAPQIFKALILAICFGSKKIVDRFEEEGVAIKKVIGIGGVARKSPYIMQTLANVLDRPILIAASDQTPALGAAIYASVAAGIYTSVEEAAEKLGSNYEAEYTPEPLMVEKYSNLMKHYQELANFVEHTTSN